MAWAAVLVVSGAVAAVYGAATVKEQRTVVQAQPTVDRAVASVAAAAGPDTPLAIGGYQTRDTCRITAVRAGVDAERVVTLYVAPGNETALLRRLAEALPRGYAATIDARGELRADPGQFVHVTGTTEAPGQVRVSAYTGCRPPGGRLTSFQVPVPTDLRADVAPVLADLGVTALSWRTYQVGCVRTLVASAPTAGVQTPAGRLTDRRPVVATADAVAYRSAGGSVVVRRDGGQLTVAATRVGC